MSLAPPVRFPMARRSERLDPHGTLQYRYHAMNGVMHDSGRR